MTSADAPMTRVTRRFYEHCRDFFARHQQEFRLRQEPPGPGAMQASSLL
jgi:hypothetical protein